MCTGGRAGRDIYTLGKLRQPAHRACPGQLKPHLCISGLSHPPEAMEADLSESTAALRLMSAPPPPAPPLPTNSCLPRVTGSPAATGPGGCITKAHWPWCGALGQWARQQTLGSVVALFGLGDPFGHTRHPCPQLDPLVPLVFIPGWWDECSGGTNSPSTGMSSPVPLTSLH